MTTRFFGIVLLIISFGCVPDKNEEVNKSELNFSTTDASELYFKNVRESYYSVDDRQDQGIKVFVYEDWNLEATYPLLNLSIVYNWQNDKAFVMANPNPYFPESAQIVVGSDTVLFEQSNMKQQLEVASAIYNGIVREETISILVNNEWKNLFSNSQDKQNFKITMYDFYRLTEVF